MPLELLPGFLPFSSPLGPLIIVLHLRLPSFVFCLLFCLETAGVWDETGRFSTLDLLSILVKMLFSQCVTPMKKQLANRWRHTFVIKAFARYDTLVNEVSSPASLFSGNRLPSRDLSVIVRRATAEIEATVPLSPSVRVLFDNPPFLFPRFQRLSRLGLVAVHRCAIRMRSDLRLYVKAFKPVARKFFPYVFQLLLDDRRVYGTEVCATKGAHLEDLLRGQIGPELLLVRKQQKPILVAVHF
mmetsp:Transcript_390/g.1316  ORF Transcript_390/g.1316 Transcript_390/m.1316 type:complete len:242 (+) Transcript_390:1797-2522(+)